MSFSPKMYKWSINTWKYAHHQTLGRASLIIQLVESACNAGDPGSIPGLGTSPGEGIGYPLQYSWASLVAQLVNNPPAMWYTWVWSLGWEDPLEKGKATHSSILAWRIPWTCIVHRVMKSQTQLSDFHFQPLEKYISDNEIPLHTYYGGYYKKAKNSKCGNNVEKFIHCWWKQSATIVKSKT